MPKFLRPFIFIPCLASIMFMVGCASRSHTAASPSLVRAQPTDAPAKVDRYLSPEAGARCVEEFVAPYRVNGKVLQFPGVANTMERTIVSQVIATNSPAVAAASEADNASTELDSLWDFRQVLGGDFSPANCPHIQEFIRVAFLDAKRVNTAVKKEFMRPRPGEADPDHPKMNPSFPSGHSSTAGLRYRLLTEVTSASPERELALCRHAWFMCFERLGVNAHYASDIAAGFVLGEVVADEVLRETREHPDGDAAKALAAAKAEWGRLQEHAH